MKKLQIIVTLIICFTSLTTVSTNSFALVIGYGNTEATNFGFAFSNPGARAAGMGGAFIGVADDATAAYTNPAGLTVLSKPEIAVEFKQTKTDVPYYYYPVTTGGALATVDSTETTDNVSFLSYTYPMEKANLTVYRHQMVDSRYSVSNNFQNGTSNNTVTKLGIVTYALAGSYKLSDRLSVGLTVGFSDFDFYNIFNTYTGGAISNSAGTSGSSNAPHATVALMWSPFDQFNLGLVYRYGPKFTYRDQYTNTNSTVTPYQIVDTFKTPDIYGAGISYRFSTGLTLAADVDYIKYSQISDDFIWSDGTHCQPNGSSQICTNDYKLDDTYEFHMGLEQVFSIKNVPLAFRGGYAFKQAHRIYNEPNGTYTAALASSIGRMFTKGDDEHVGSVGLGVVLGKNFQIDAAASYSNFTTEYISSLVFRF